MTRLGILTYLRLLNEVARSGLRHAIESSPAKNLQEQGLRLVETSLSRDTRVVFSVVRTSLRRTINHLFDTFAVFLVEPLLCYLTLEGLLLLNVVSAGSLLGLITLVPNGREANQTNLQLLICKLDSGI